MESALLHAASASATQSLSFLDIALWVVLPYASFAILIVGLVQPLELSAGVPLQDRPVRVDVSFLAVE